jgi:hypothetical protein
MKNYHSRFNAVAAALLACSAAVTAQAAPLEIGFRSFSSSAALQQPADDYAKKLKGITETVVPGDVVTFKRLGTPVAPLPALSGNVLDIVSRGGPLAGNPPTSNAATNGLDAAYMSGGDLNPTWGFLYNSGVPFGPTFDEYMGFLFGRSIADANGVRTHNGLELMEAILQARGKQFVVVPVGGHTEQGSGYFKKPVGNVPGTPGIGLKGLCQEFWTFRYLPPAENVLNRACDNLVASGETAKNIKFIAAVPGGGSLLGGVRDGQLQAFEFASPWDDWSQVFKQTLTKNGVITHTDANPATFGLRYMHFPGWHQQWLLTYMIINKTVWDNMTDAQRTLIRSVGRDNVVTSYGDNLAAQGEFLSKILNDKKNDGDPSNDMVLTAWPKKDLELLRDATIQFLNARAGDTVLDPIGNDRSDYMNILEALRKHVQANDLYWDIRQVPTKMRFEDWENVNRESWEDKNKRK